MTRRFVMRAIPMAALLLCLAPLARPAHAQPKPVVVIQSGEAATLDWHMHCDKNAHEPDRQIFDTLLRRNPKTLQLEGNLAESWRTVNDTTWQFKLKRNVKFHNGEPFDAAAVKFSIERMLNPKQGAPGRTSIATIDHVDVVDPYTVNVVTKAPFPLLPVRMSPGHCGTVGIVPPKYLAQVGDAGFAVKPVGTGPFKFVEWVKDERLVLEANKDYHRGAPAIDRLIFRPVPELTTRVAALVSGQADLVSDIPPDQTGKIQSSGNAHVEISSLGGFVIMVKMTNYLMPGPWQDVRVRKAINYAIDMDTIIKTVLEGYGVVLGVPLEKEAFGFNPNIKWYGYDPERAKALLREAGYANGFEMTLHAPNRRYMNDIEVMQAMAQMLSKVGIKAKVEVWEQSVYTTKWRKRELLPAYMTRGAARASSTAICSRARSIPSPRWPSSRTRRSTRCWRRPRPPTTRSAGRRSTGRRRSSSTSRPPSSRHISRRTSSA